MKGLISKMKNRKYSFASKIILKAICAIDDYRERETLLEFMNSFYDDGYKAGFEYGYQRAREDFTLENMLR